MDNVEIVNLINSLSMYAAVSMLYIAPRHVKVRIKVIINIDVLMIANLIRKKFKLNLTIILDMVL